MKSTQNSSETILAKSERDDLSAWGGVVSFFGWTRHSSILLSVFFLTIALIVYVWWPLAEEVLSYIDWAGEWWLYMDWLLIGIFLVMSIAIVSRADLRVDSLVIFVATLGGLAIESWGTQTNLWHYYTAERPPLWIIPAWPIATLTINRLVRLLLFLNTKVTREHKGKNTQSLSGAERRRRAVSLGAPSFDCTVRAASTPVRDGRLKNSRLPLKNWNLLKTAYWLLFTGFFALMLYFVAPTFDKSYTLLSLLLVALLIITPTDYRMAVLTFVAGTVLGYFLELWGTTRECWTYYTYQTPPLFAVLAHGMAAVAFWRTELLMKTIFNKIGENKFSTTKTLGKQK